MANQMKNVNDLDQYVPLITKVAASLYKKHYGLAKKLNIDFDEYGSLAAIGFFKSMKNFDPQKCNTIGKYAYNFMRQEIRTYIDKCSTNDRNRADAEIMNNISAPMINTGGDGLFCFHSLMEIFSDKLSDIEVAVLNMVYLDRKSIRKVETILGLKNHRAETILRHAHQKLQKAILEYGDVNNINDIKSNIIKAHGKKKVTVKHVVIKSQKAA